MRCLRGIFVLMALIWQMSAKSAEADKWIFDHLSASDILPSDVVHRVAQGKDGEMWIATGSALCRYDGSRLLCYRRDEKNPTLLPANDVICVAACSRRLLWVGTQEGLCLLDPAKNISATYLLKGQSKQRVNDICVMRSGETFFATIRGLFRWDAKLRALVRVGGAHSPGSINLQSICQLGDGRLLIASWEHGLYLLDVKRNVFVHVPQLNGVSRYMAVRALPNGEVWAGTYGHGAQRLSISRSGKMVATTLFDGEYVGGMSYSPADRHVWIATRRGVLLDSGERLLADCGEVRDIFCDRSGRLWIPTIGRGVYVASLRQPVPVFTSLFEGQGAVTALAAMPGGSLWIAHNYGLAYRGANGLQTELLPDKRVYSISRGRRPGDVWIALHDGGVSLGRQGKIIRNYNVRNCRFLPHQDVQMAAEDEAGNLWVASSQGLGVRYADGRQLIFSQLRHAPHILKSELLSVLVAHDHSLWLAAPDSIVHLQGSLSRPLTLRCLSYPVGAKPVQLFEDSRSNVWLATDGDGLCLLERGRFVSVNDRWKIPAPTVSSLCEDADGNLWIGTAKGLAEITAQGKSHFYTTRDGLPYNYFTPATAACAGAHIYMGSSQGVVAVSPHVPTSHAAILWAVAAVILMVVLVAALCYRAWSRRRHGSKMELNETLSGADQEFVNRAMAVVRLHLSDADFTTQQLVSEMATSKTTLFNKLKTLTGKNATTFIRDIRMDHARRIMDDEPDVRISEVAYRVGYNDPKYFSLCFKNCFGISPSVYLETKGGGT